MSDEKELIKTPIAEEAPEETANAEALEEKFDVRRKIFHAVADTNMMFPGMTTYQIKELPPTVKKPWVTFYPVKRVIIDKSSNGANGGSTFITYAPVMKRSIGPSQADNPNNFIDYELESFFTPLTEHQAMVICYKLNVQMRGAYEEKMRKVK